LGPPLPPLTREFSSVNAISAIPPNFRNFCSRVQIWTYLSQRTGRGRMPCSPPTPQRKPLKLTSLFCTAHHLLRISLRRQKLHVPPPSVPLALSRARVPSSRHPFNTCHAGYVKSGSDLYRSPELLQ